MATIFNDLMSEVADNWPAFLYIAVTAGFSICFLRERRAETRILRRMGEGLEARIDSRLDRLESLLRHPSTVVPAVESLGNYPELFIENERKLAHRSTSC